VFWWTFPPVFAWGADVGMIKREKQMRCIENAAGSLGYAAIPLT
jgi:hypothetical protein